MPKSVILVRHGQAESRSSYDYDRALTAHGRTLLEEAYPETFATIAALSETQTIEIWASIAQRAQETAEIIADTLGKDAKDIQTFEELYSQDTKEVLDLIGSSEVDTLIVVTHIPLVASLGYALADEFFEFNPGAVVMVDLVNDLRAPGKPVWYRPGPEA